eukprot:366113-Chlamydomonas_euryale.AAC.14
MPVRQAAAGRHLQGGAGPGCRDCMLRTLHGCMAPPARLPHLLVQRPVQGHGADAWPARRTTCSPSHPLGRRTRGWRPHGLAPARHTPSERPPGCCSCWPAGLMEGRCLCCAGCPRRGCEVNRSHAVGVRCRRMLAPPLQRACHAAPTHGHGAAAGTYVPPQSSLTDAVQDQVCAPHTSARASHRRGPRDAHSPQPCPSTDVGDTILPDMALSTCRHVAGRTLSRRTLLQPLRSSRPSSVQVRSMSKQVIATDKAPAALGPYRWEQSRKAGG